MPVGKFARIGIQAHIYLSFSVDITWFFRNAVSHLFLKSMRHMAYVCTIPLFAVPASSYLPQGSRASGCSPDDRSFLNPAGHSCFLPSTRDSRQLQRHTCETIPPWWQKHRYLHRTNVPKTDHWIFSLQRFATFLLTLPFPQLFSKTTIKLYPKP